MEAPYSRGQKENPLRQAGFCSRIFFWWLNPLFITGHKRKLEEDDMYKVLTEDSSKVLGEELQWYWDKEIQKAKKEARTPHLTKAIMLCYWKSYFALGFFTLIEEAFHVIQPVLLGMMIAYFENIGSINDDEHALKYAYISAAALSLCTIVLAISHHLYFYHVQRAGMKLRVAMCHMIYRKALRLSNTAMGKTTTGQIVNLLSNDVNKFDQVTIFLHYLWAAPLQVTIISVLLWMEIGPACLAGMAVLIILLPLQSLLGKLFSSLRSRTAALTDVRIRTMNEVIAGMRIIKMYAWEKSFADLVSSIRRKEISMVLKSSYLRGMNLASFFIASKITMFMTFMTYVLLGNVITASRVFVAVSLYSTVRLTVTLFFPAAIEKVSEALVSNRRIKNFLILDEVSQLTPQLKTNNEVALAVHDLTCYWDKTLEMPTLQKIAFTVRPGELLIVIGPVGAGKSSLLSAILGELSASKGFIDVQGRIAYVSQQPWVFSGTVRNNILFGKEYYKDRYEKVLKACALKKDMELLADGDLTVIGDRGVTLSGGQKARVNLARAVYQDADIYLLDDPLSAVDAEVSRHLFEKCICQTLHKKVCILVTHQLQYLQAAKQILILKEGVEVGKGTYSDILKSGIDFASLLKKPDDDQVPLPGTAGHQLSRIRTFSESSVWSMESSVQSQKDGAAEPPPMEPLLTALPEESRSEGKIGFNIYKKYFAAGANYFVIFIIFSLNILAQVAYVLQDWWLSYWANEQLKLNVTAMANAGINETRTLDLDWYLGMYAGFTVVTVLFSILRNILMFQVLVNAAQTLHNSMFQSILKAPVLFFDSNPIGRILNRFSKDIGHLDDLLPLTFLDFVQTFLQICGVVAVAIAVIPWVLIPLVPLLILFIMLRRYFLATSRDIKRLESTTRSPVFSHLSSSLQGLWTIRAFKAEQRFQELFDAHQDLHTEAWFLFLTTSRWFAVRLDAICAVLVVVVAFGSLLLAHTLDAGQVGLALSYSITLMGMFQWGVRQSAETENLMISAERVMEYTDVEKEAPWESNKRPPSEWPSEGVIAFENVNFTYSIDGPLVLRHLTAVIKSKEKIGIVGRTGAGKSSLIAALFRLAEPQGRIWIDKYLTSELGLHDLRKKISIIPQEPVLFTGSMRRNLDPFDEYTDEELWSSLEEVQLKETIEELPNKLETQLAESGSNFSVGQRQLVCLARAILKKNKILIIDEATANVDPRTDELIQKTIREKFAQCTVLTIAHRLNTIIDSDRIMVLDSGRLKEYDEPYILLQEKESLFYKMVQQLGKAEAESIKETAKQVYFKKNYPEVTPNGQAATKSVDDSQGLIIFETAV
ncbi:ATP-binding cassette sub-family C member 4 [Anolis carolinensis]|uniref:ATP-binding cassette sub-family C member 4 n=1 Tax=Anolis carolinensis TaxID=28377 RepID=UPI0007DB73EA|nr:PREDICTED: multidrug resistance-associated protein 4 [Anolis carolinensis]|eukprot:XP_003218714.2 PREDICTED: multidrug resistance-associated protein 4 [Anolis carolinensis]